MVGEQCCLVSLHAALLLGDLSVMVSFRLSLAPNCQVQAYLTCCKLRSAYLIAVKQEHSRAAVLVERVQQAARSSGDAVVQDICSQWLLSSRSRGAHGSASRKWPRAAGPDSCGAGVMGTLPALSSCGAGLPWLHPRLERAGIGPDLPSWAKIGNLSRKCHVSVKLWSLCVFVWRWPVLSTSEWVCVCARSSRSCLRSSISEQSSPPLQRGTLLSTSACLKTFLRFWFLTRVHPVCTQSPWCGDVPEASRDYKGFWQNDGAASERLPLFRSFPSPDAEIALGQVLPVVWDRSKHLSSHKHKSYCESLEGSLNRRVLRCWHLKAVDAWTPDGVWNPRHGQEGRHCVHPQGEKGEPLQTALQVSFLQAQNWLLLIFLLPSKRTWLPLGESGGETVAKVVGPIG